MNLVAPTPEVAHNRYRSLALATNLIVWNVNAAGQFIDHSDAWNEFTGQGRDEYAGQWHEAFHPEDAEKVRLTWREASQKGNPFEIETRLRTKEGVFHRAILRGVPVFSQNQRTPVEWVGTITDVEQTRRADEELRHSHDQAQELARQARRQAQEERDNLFQKLVEAQEKERARISRELHDSFGQNLTALLLGLSVLERDTKDLEPQNEQTLALAQKIRALQDLTQRVLAQSGDLARELRPASLDNLGLPAALRLLTSDFQRDHGLSTDFQQLGFETDALRWSHDIEITLFRVLQESLTNVARHARAKHVSVVIEKRGEMVSLVVEDDGVGFDAEAKAGTTRLGLLGMRERLEAVGGTLEIESGASGTTIFARVLLKKPQRG